MRYRAATSGAADWLSLAAAPAFAIMALLTGISGGGAMDMLCSAAHGASWLGGMVPMYALMSAFHLGPWLRLLSRSRSGARSITQLRVPVGAAPAGRQIEDRP
jgi:hypothetical protein